MAVKVGVPNQDRKTVTVLNTVTVAVTASLTVGG